MINFIITGGNRGIGKEMVKTLANLYKEKKVYFTSRVEDEGIVTMKEIGMENVFHHQLDICSSDSIKNFAQFVKEQGGFEVLINNAGFASKGSTITEELARYTCDVNYKGTMNLTKALFPYIQKHGRIINVSSTMGQLNDSYSNEMKKRFLDPNATEKSLDKLQEEFILSVKNGTIEKDGFPSNAYRVSKCLLNSWTRIFARDHATEDGPFIAAVHPGWVRTRMGGPNASLSLEEGVETPIFTVTEPFDVMMKDNGKFWEKKKVESY